MEEQAERGELGLFQEEPEEGAEPTLPAPEPEAKAEKPRDKPELAGVLPARSLPEIPPVGVVADLRLEAVLKADTSQKASCVFNECVSVWPRP